METKAKTYYLCRNCNDQFSVSITGFHRLIMLHYENCPHCGSKDTHPAVMELHATKRLQIPKKWPPQN